MGKRTKRRQEDVIAGLVCGGQRVRVDAGAAGSGASSGPLGPDRRGQLRTAALRNGGRAGSVHQGQQLPPVGARHSSQLTLTL